MATGVYEHWRIPGCKDHDGVMSANDGRVNGAAQFIASASRSFKIYFLDSMGIWPWKLAVNRPLGTSRPIDNYESIDEFSTWREALAEGRRMARESAK